MRSLSRLPSGSLLSSACPPGGQTADFGQITEITEPSKWKWKLFLPDDLTLVSISYFFSSTSWENLTGSSGTAGQQQLQQNPAGAVKVATGLQQASIPSHLLPGPADQSLPSLSCAFLIQTRWGSSQSCTTEWRNLARNWELESRALFKVMKVKQNQESAG